MAMEGSTAHSVEENTDVSEQQNYNKAFLASDVPYPLGHNVHQYYALLMAMGNKDDPNEHKRCADQVAEWIIVREYLDLEAAGILSNVEPPDDHDFYDDSGLDSINVSEHTSGEETDMYSSFKSGVTGSPESLSKDD